MSAIRTPTKAVAPRGIPDALRAIWRDCCSGEPDGTVSRSLLANLLVVVEADRETSLRAELDRLVARLPCRLFLAVVTANGGAIAAEVHGAARTHGAIRDLVLEHIELRVPRTAMDQLAGVVRPLFVNDIPTHLYWSAPWPREVRAFDALAKAVDHTIVDSTRFELPATELDAVDLRRRQGRALTDLTWLRLRPWRKAMAEVFERQPYDQDLATSVTVRHGQHGLAAAALFGRWLERRLAATIAIEAGTDAHADLESVTLQHGDAVAHADMSDHRIEVSLATAAACHLPFSVPASQGSEGDLVAAAIDLA